MTMPSVPSVLACCILSTTAPSQLLRIQVSLRNHAKVYQPLEEISYRAQTLSLLLPRSLNIGEGLMAIDVWLTNTQQIQIRPIDDQDSFLPVAHGSTVQYISKNGDVGNRGYRGGRSS